MFAEDVDLLPRDSFTALLESVRADPAAAVPLLKGLFDEMNRGGYSLALRTTLLHFNGGLFAGLITLLDGTRDRAALVNRGEFSAAGSTGPGVASRASARVCIMASFQGSVDPLRKN